MNNLNEEWKHISKHSIPIGYEISSLGRVRVNYGDHYEFVPDKIDNTGYHQIHLRGTTLKIHRLVAEEFLPNPENKRFVNHKDLNKNNNSVSNLEWVTAVENSHHAILNNAGASGKTVRCVTTGKIYSSLMSAQYHVGIPTTAIEESCKSGDNCFGLKFEYVELDKNVDWFADGNIYIPTSLFIKCSKEMTSYSEFQKKYHDGVSDYAGLLS